MAQSIYYDQNDKMLYKVVSYKDQKEIITTNGIAKYSLSGGAPSYNTVTFQGLYTVENYNDLPFFELEAMSSDSNGKKYAAANAKYTNSKGNKKDCDAIYQIELK